MPLVIPLIHIINKLAPLKIKPTCVDQIDYSSNVQILPLLYWGNLDHMRGSGFVERLNMASLSSRKRSLYLLFTSTPTCRNVLTILLS